MASWRETLQRWRSSSATFRGMSSGRSWTIIFEGQRAGVEDAMSPCSMGAAHGELPSGEVSAAGQTEDKHVTGEHKPGKNHFIVSSNFQSHAR